MSDSVETAAALIERGYVIFPVKPTKEPYASDGLKSASSDLETVLAEFKRHPEAVPAIHTGRSGISVLDIDLKTDDSGEVLVDGFDALEKAWYDLPESFTYSSISGNGQHLMWRAPEGVNLAPKAGYRKMKGVDRRSGESYVVFPPGSPLPPRVSDLAPAPEWFNDVTTVHTESRFEGSVKDWYDALTPGEPNVLVRRAIADVQESFATQGNDLSHSDIVEYTYRAIRLGCEANSGVEALLNEIERLATSREGEHSRNPDEWAHEFQECLVSGIARYGEPIRLLSEMPEYTTASIPSDVSASLFLDIPARDRRDISTRITALQRSLSDDMKVLSIMWNAAATKDLTREWGLEFVHQLVVNNRLNPVPMSENPALAVEATTVARTGLLTPEEVETVAKHPTFIDDYLAAAHRARGFNNRAYDVPAAWTLLNLVFGTKAFLPHSKKLEMNLWFTMLGDSGTGKSTALEFYHHIANTFTTGQDTRYQISANSSPDGVEVSLLERDELASVLYADEASGWLKNIAKKDWMASLTDRLSEWYDGGVYGSNNLARREYRGKSARTSLGMLMAATPDLFTKLLMSEMFEQGFYARVNWTWAEDAPEDTEDRYFMDFVEFSDEAKIPADALAMVGSLAVMRLGLPEDRVIRLDAAPGVQARLAKASKQMADVASQYDAANSGVTSPSARRTGPQTAWKCAALLALSQGRNRIEMEDALAALTYVEEWFATLFRVVEAAGNGEFNRDVDEIEKYVRSKPHGVTYPTLIHRFRNLIVRSPRELDDRIDFLQRSGRVVRTDEDGKIKLTINGSAKQKENDE